MFQTKKLDGRFMVRAVVVVYLTPLVFGATLAPVPLGSNSTFAVLAGTTVTIAAGAAINGNVGINPGSAFFAGSPPANGNIYAGVSISAQAQSDLTVAYNDAAGRQAPTIISGNLGGQTLAAGLYKSTSSLSISSGDLVLDGQGDPNAVFIFQIASTFTMTTGRQVILAGGATASRIFWQVGDSATLGMIATLHGNILAASSISMQAGATLDGRALARNGSVNVDTAGIAVPPPPGLQFVPVTPCRLADTRNPAGAFGGPVMSGGTTRSFPVSSGSCGIPAGAQAYSLNVAVVPRGLFAYLTMWPTGQIQPTVATLNSDGRVKSAAAIIPAGNSGAVNVFVTHDTDLVLDINGYFVSENTSGVLAYYPLTQCRVLDTRGPTGPLGGPFLAGQSTRTIPIGSSACNVPSSAVVYLINLAAVPRNALGYMTAWATGTPRPGVASLNDTDATVVANAALVVKGTGGSINVFTSNDTHLVIDIAGYFAPPGTGGLSLHNLTPCRVLDSRFPSGSPMFTGAIDVGVNSTSCGAPASARAFVLNATVIPQLNLGYLTLWEQGTAQPGVATLISLHAVVAGNLAVVSTSNGSMSAFASNPTYLILDIFGYFAP